MKKKLTEVQTHESVKKQNKATKIHYFFAQGWLEKIWLIVFSSMFVIYGTFGEWGFIFQLSCNLLDRIDTFFENN